MARHGPGWIWNQFQRVGLERYAGRCCLQGPPGHLSAPRGRACTLNSFSHHFAVISKIGFTCEIVVSSASNQAKRILFPSLRGVCCVFALYWCAVVDKADVSHHHASGIADCVRSDSECSWDTYPGDVLDGRLATGQATWYVQKEAILAKGGRFLGLWLTLEKRGPLGKSTMWATMGHHCFIRSRWPGTSVGILR